MYPHAVFWKAVRGREHSLKRVEALGLRQRVQTPAQRLNGLDPLRWLVERALHLIEQLVD
ncbi:MULTISPECIES: hypothetical protein [Burkholderiaceae]|uniref:hypothetical protein n=1 Tax=Burkholderiaceae TaxID=119060 RepID=UPI0030CCF42C